jgi:tetratricopeptide (TPR) repeat protein
LYGENHPKTVSKMAKLATAAFNTNDEVRFKEVLTSVRPYLEKWASSDNLTLRLAAAEVMDAMIVSMTTHFSESFQVARQAEKLYSSLPKKEFNLDRHHYLAMIYFKNFAFVNAVQHFDAAEERRRQKGEMFGAHIPTWHAQYFAFVGRYAEADKKFELARTIETHNQVPGVAQGNWVLAQVANYLTDTSRATESLSLNSRAFSAAADTPNVQLAPHALWARGKALARFGPIEEGLKLVTQANEIASQTGDTMAEIHIAYDHINALLELGRLDEAAVRLQSEKKLLEAGQFEMSSDSRQYWRLQIALHLAMGNIAKARELVEHSRAVLAPAGAGVGELLMGEWLEASVELQEGKLDQASHRLEAAIQRVAKSPDHLLMREWHANLEELRGVSLVAQGDRAAAQRSFEKALALNTAIFDAKTSIPVARVSLRLANLHKVAGRLKEAQFFQGRADAIRRTHPLFKQWVL